MDTRRCALIFAEYRSPVKHRTVRYMGHQPRVHNQMMINQMRTTHPSEVQPLRFEYLLSNATYHFLQKYSNTKPSRNPMTPTYQGRACPRKHTSRANRYTIPESMADCGTHPGAVCCCLPPPPLLPYSVPPYSGDEEKCVYLSFHHGQI